LGTNAGARAIEAQAAAVNAATVGGGRRRRRGGTYGVAVANTPLGDADSEARPGDFGDSASDGVTLQ